VNVPPPLPPGGEFGPEGALPPGGELGPVAPLPPVFVPPPEQLEFIRGDDKDSKKDAIFNLAGQDGGLSGLVSTLAEDELNDLIFEFQDDLEFWDTLGIAPPPLPPGGECCGWYVLGW
jgi:hypothetical protein